MPRPMMNSVEPPPMSMTSRGSSRRRQHVRDAEVDEPRLLVAGDDVDREAQRALGLRQELRRVLRDAERVGRDGAHRRRVQAAQPLARSGRGRRAPRAARCGVQVAVGVDARAHAQRLAPGVEAEDLVALDAADLEPEAVGAHVDDGERRGGERRVRGMMAAQSLADARRARSGAVRGSRCGSLRLLRLADCPRSRRTAMADRLPAEDPDRQGLRRRDRDAARPRADAVARARQPRAAEARGPAAGVLVQAARRLQQDGAPVAPPSARAA